MKFNYLIAMIAIVSLAAEANAATGGGALRRAQAQAVEVAQNDAAQTQTQVIVIPGGQQAATQQPTTVVEAAPVTESKAEVMRKARQDAELHTEQKIVEKLEESRLREEQQRAERLFGDRMETQAAAAPAAAAAVTQAAPATAPAPAVVTPAPAPVAAPAQVTIEKVEIVQPATPKSEVEPVAESKASLNDEALKEEASTSNYNVGGVLALPQYNAGNVKTQYGLGFTVGSMIDENNGIELGFLYSSYLIDTFWKFGLYNEMTQYDFSATYKYYILTGKVKPYVGGSVTYIARTYQDRVKSGIYYNVNKSESESTNAVDVGLVGGVEYIINSKVSLGAGLDYNHNVMSSRNNFTSAYNLNPADTKALEEIDFYTFKVTGKVTF